MFPIETNHCGHLSDFRTEYPVVSVPRVPALTVSLEPFHSQGVKPSLQVPKVFKVFAVVVFVVVVEEFHLLGDQLSGLAQRSS